MASTVTQRFEALVTRAEEARNDQTAGQKIIVQVGSATCEHAAGSRDVLDEFHKHIAASARDDIILHQTGCTGRCSREPIVGVLMPGQMPVKYERVDRELVHEIFTKHLLEGQPLWDRVLDGPVEQAARYEVLYCGSDRCDGNSKRPSGHRLAKKLRAAGVGTDLVRLTPASCFGCCASSQQSSCLHLLVRPDKILYRVGN